MKYKVGLGGLTPVSEMVLITNSWLVSEIIAFSLRFKWKAVTMNLLWGKSIPTVTAAHVQGTVKYANSLIHPSPLSNLRLSFAQSLFLNVSCKCIHEYLCNLYFVSMDFCRWTCSSFPLKAWLNQSSNAKEAKYGATHINDPFKIRMSLYFIRDWREHIEVLLARPKKKKEKFTSSILLPLCFGHADWYNLSAQGQVTWQAHKIAPTTVGFPFSYQRSSFPTAANCVSFKEAYPT